MVTLYGNGAFQFSDGKNTYYSRDGFVTLPEPLVPQALQLGFTRTKPEPEPVKEVAAVVVAAPVAPVIPPLAPGDLGEGTDAELEELATPPEG